MNSTNNGIKNELLENPWQSLNVRTTCISISHCRRCRRRRWVMIFLLMVRFFGFSILFNYHAGGTLSVGCGTAWIHNLQLCFLDFFLHFFHFHSTILFAINFIFPALISWCTSNVNSELLQVLIFSLAFISRREKLWEFFLVPFAVTRKKWNKKPAFGGIELQTRKSCWHLPHRETII